MLKHQGIIKEPERAKRSRSEETADEDSSSTPSLHETYIIIMYIETKVREFDEHEVIKSKAHILDLEDPKLLLERYPDVLFELPYFCLHIRFM